MTLSTMNSLGIGLDLIAFHFLQSEPGPTHFETLPKYHSTHLCPIVCLHIIFPSHDCLRLCPNRGSLLVLFPLSFHHVIISAEPKSSRFIGAFHIVFTSPTHFCCLPLSRRIGAETPVTLMSVQGNVCFYTFFVKLIFSPMFPHKAQGRRLPLCDF